MIRFLFLVSFHVCWFLVHAQTTVHYSLYTDAIANPERGFQKYSITNSNYHTVSNYSNISEAELIGWRTGKDKVTVIFRYFLLDAYLNSNISPTFLANIQIDFHRIRNAGLKCIVRFSYRDAQSALAQQPSKSQIIQHLQQVAPIVEANKDVIFSHQAGFIGTWGEWYYTNSAEFGTDGSINTLQWQNRKEVIEAMLVATPVEIPIQVRYPQIKKTMCGNSFLNSETAYQTTANARIGFFNDAFLNNWGDMGTYEVRRRNEDPTLTSDYAYLSNETQYLPMSGETNGLNPPRTNGSNALLELNSANWTTLNRDYFERNITNWINSGHYMDMQRYLGYRLVLQNSTFTLNGLMLDVSISLENIGYARIFKNRKAWLVLQNSSNGQVFSFILNTDPRTWESAVTIKQRVDLSGLPAGNYECLLNLPDPSSSISNRPEYSIQFANSDLWEPSTGFNKLNQLVELGY
jgi:hypothetical protein